MGLVLDLLEEGIVWGKEESHFGRGRAWGIINDGPQGFRKMLLRGV